MPARIVSVLVVPALGAVLLSVGCARMESASTWDGAVRDSAGITIVDNHGQPLWREEDRWTLKEVLRIGTVGGEPEYQFGRISGSGVLSDGRVVVADQLAQTLRFFSPEGEYESTIGTPGSGPRDFGRGYLDLLVATGDTILVPDWANRQVHIIAPEGTWLGSWRMAPEDGWVIRAWDDAPTGRVITLMTPLQTPDSPVTDTLDLVLVRDVRGEVLDTLARVSRSRVFRLSGDAPEWHFWAAYPDIDLRWHGGLVTGRTDEYRLTWYDRNGNLERIVSMDRDREPLTDGDRRLLLDRFESIYREGGYSTAEIAQYKSAVHFEDYYPAWRRFICGVDGTVWVQRLQPASALGRKQLEVLSLSRPPATAEWDVFDAEGRYLGVVDMPTGSRAFRFAGDRVYGVWEDELDVQYVVAWRIEGLGKRQEG